MPKLNAKPEPLEIDFDKSAIVVVDMQNAFASRGGMLDLAGVDLSGAARVVGAIRATIDAARAAAVPVVFLQMGYKPDLSNSGGPTSPNWHKELAMRLMHTRPDLQGKLLTEGTWDFAIVDELAPQPGDLLVVKTRYSGFAGTTLDSQLRVRGIRYLYLHRGRGQCLRRIDSARRLLPRLLAHPASRRLHGRGQPRRRASNDFQRRILLRMDDEHRRLAAPSQLACRVRTSCGLLTSMLAEL